MYDVVPGALQRLREADIVSTAGLTVASLGQEYCRTGAVQAAQRQGARLSGIVAISGTPRGEGAAATYNAKDIAGLSTAPGTYRVEVEVREPGVWITSCTCKQSSGAATPVCAHAAALLYQWLAHPLTFSSQTAGSPSTSIPPLKNRGMAPGSFHAPERGALPAKAALERGLLEESPAVAQSDSKAARPAPGEQPEPGPVPVLREAGPVTSTAETLAQLGLNDLRAIAREYDISTNGLSRQELADAIVEKLNQPEAVRRVVGMLEKAQRQFLAALTLAGGYLNEDDLRGLFERFSLGRPDQLQNALVALQSRALIMRVSFSSSFQPRLGLTGSPLEVSWYVPPEVSAALHVTLPVTPFRVEANVEGYDVPPHIQTAEPYTLLADLLLVARALDGDRLEQDEKKSERGGTNTAESMGRSPNTSAAGGSIAIPPPAGLPSPALLDWLQPLVPRSTAFLRFAFRILRLADILYRDDGGTPGLRILPNAAELLLGSARTEVAYELFAHWLRQSTYEELYDLQEEGLRLRCRATPLGQPALRFGELETENSEARQSLVALLAQAPLHQWISFPAFARLVYRLTPAFLQRRQRLFTPQHWWIENQEGRRLHPVQLSDWLLAEGRYLARLLQGPLHWWGINDLALAPDGRLLAFRLTSMAKLLLKGMLRDETPELPLPGAPEQDAPAIAASESGELLLASSAANWPVIELVERFAEVQGIRAGQLCYRLTPQSFGAALSRGEAAAPLLDLLRQAMEQAGTADGALARMLHQLERRVANYGRVRLYAEATLLEVADTLVIRELSATTSLDKQIIRSIHPTLLLLKKQGGELLVEELKGRGQLPLLHEEG